MLNESLLEDVVRDSSGDNFADDDPYVPLAAAHYINDGLHGRSIGYKTDPKTLELHKLYHSKVWLTAVTGFAVIHMLLAFVERPLQHRTSMEIRTLITTAIEIPCLLAYVADLRLAWKCWGETLYKHGWTVARSVLVFSFVFDLSVNCLSGFNTMRFSRGLRPFYLIVRRRNLRKLFRGSLKTVPRILGIFTLIACLIMFFALAGYILFAAEVDQYFSSFYLGVYHLFRLHTSAPFILPFMKPYFEDVSEWTAVLFVSFVLIGNIFLFKLVIAVSYRSFKAHTNEIRRSKQVNRKIAFDAAFELLQVRDRINFESFFTVLCYTRELLGLRPLTREQTIEILGLVVRHQTGQQGIDSKTSTESTNGRMSVTAEEAYTQDRFHSVDQRGSEAAVDRADVRISDLQDVPAAGGARGMQRPSLRLRRKKLSVEDIPIDRELWYCFANLMTLRVHPAEIIRYPAFHSWRLRMRKMLRSTFVVGGQVRVRHADVPVYCLILLSACQLVICAHPDTTTFGWRVVGMCLMILFWVTPQH